MKSAAAFENFDRIIFAASISSLPSDALSAGAADMVAGGSAARWARHRGDPASGAIGSPPLLGRHANRRRFRAHVVVAKGDDELRHLRGPVDLDVDAIDVRGALAPVVHVLELELPADPQEFEVRADE